MLRCLNCHMCDFTESAKCMVTFDSFNVITCGIDIFTQCDEQLVVFVQCCSHPESSS